jgi:hypothetical protein
MMRKYVRCEIEGEVENVGDKAPCFATQRRLKEEA